MDRSYVEENRLELERLRALVSRLTDDDMARPIGHGWTVGAALAHLAYWDRRNAGLLTEWTSQGEVRAAPSVADSINDEMLPRWLAAPSAEVRREVIAAAEATDRAAAEFPEALAEQLMARRPRTLIRAMHRQDHLEEVERALRME